MMRLSAVVFLLCLSLFVVPGYNSLDTDAENRRYLRQHDHNEHSRRFEGFLKGLAGFNKTVLPKNSYNLPSVPDIFIIGAAKCATSSLHVLLLRHPDVCDSGIKEKHFFDEPRIMFDSRSQAQNLAAYMRVFDENPGQKNVNCRYQIDSTPAYFRSPWVVHNINATFTPTQLAKKKFILVLREPTARECSWYRHVAFGCVAHLEEQMARTPPNKQGEWPKSICQGGHGHYCEKLECGKHSGSGPGDAITAQNYFHHFDSFAKYISKNVSGTGNLGSHYDKQLQKWLKIVRRDQLFILNMEDLISRTPLVMKKISKFLELTSRGYGDDVVLPESNTNEPTRKVPECDCATFDKLKAMYDELDTVANTMLLINATDRHPLEPPFSPFNYKRKCA